jgi:hypothetical protein
MSAPTTDHQRSADDIRAAYEAALVTAEFLRQAMGGTAPLAEGDDGE